MSIFEQASRKKLRFDTSMGQLTADDLWDLPLSGLAPDASGRRGYTTGPTLNGIAVEIYSKVQRSAVSFVDPEPNVDTDMLLRFDIVKRIIEVRVEERKEATEARAKAERKQKLLGVLARKQDAELEGMSVEQIRELIDAT